MGREKGPPLNLAWGPRGLNPALSICLCLCLYVCLSVCLPASPFLINLSCPRVIQNGNKCLVARRHLQLLLFQRTPGEIKSIAAGPTESQQSTRIPGQTMKVYVKANDHYDNK